MLNLESISRCEANTLAFERGDFEFDRHLARMVTLEELLRKHTWFTEGSTKPSFSNSGTLGSGWVQRYGIDAAVHELNCHWIAGRQKAPLSSRMPDHPAMPLP